MLLSLCVVICISPVLTTQPSINDNISLLSSMSVSLTLAQSYLVHVHVDAQVQSECLLSCSFDPDPSAKNTFWQLIVGVMVEGLGLFGASQVTVQRYCALPTLRKAKM